MKCLRPFIREKGERASEWACYSRCPACLLNRRRIWTHRLILETFSHDDSCFATLTYDKDKVPADGSLRIDHYQKFLRRLRKLYAPKEFRFFISGEYGPVSNRPHYHAIIFGMDQFVAGGIDGQHGLVQAAWSSKFTGGFTYCGSVTPASCAYVAGYVTKKIKEPKKIKHENDRRWYYEDGRIAQFVRMSLRPGIGYGAVAPLCSAYEYYLHKYMDDGLSSKPLHPLPVVLRHGKGLLPLGRYVRQKLSIEVAKRFMGDTFEKDPRETLKEMQELRIKNEHVASCQAKTYSEIVIDKGIQKLRNLIARDRIFLQENTL